MIRMCMLGNGFPSDRTGALYQDVALAVRYPRLQDGFTGSAFINNVLGCGAFPLTLRSVNLEQQGRNLSITP